MACLFYGEYRIQAYFPQDEERLEVVEAKRKIEEERQVLEKELRKKEKMIQNQILGKSDSNSRPRISFGVKKKWKVL